MIRRKSNWSFQAYPMRQEVFAALVVGLLVAALVGASLGVSYFAGSQVTKTITSATTNTTTQTSFLTLTTTSTLSTTSVFTTISAVPGIELIAGVSPSVIASGQNISVNFGIYNPLQTNVSVGYNESRNPSEGPCSSGPAFIRLYAGYYDFVNVSSATPLWIWNASVFIECPRPASVILTFQPNSDKAMAQILDLVYNNVWTLNYTVELSGYWVNCCLAGPGPSYVHQVFPQGRYSVLVFDSWGQQELKYFTVS